MAKISCVLITRDEEKNIAGCLQSASFCDESIVVDSESRDRTRELAAGLGAKVLVRPFSGFSDQKNYGIRQASGDWIFLIDADERVSAELRGEILRAADSSLADGYLIPRLNDIFGRRMRHGAHAGDTQLRLVRRNKGLFEGAVHERVHCTGVVSKLKSPLYHRSTESLGAYMKKLNHYTSLEALELSKKGPLDLEKQMKRKPLLKFLSDMLLKQGIRDGWEGFLFGFLSAYYDFIKRAKAWELSARHDKINRSVN